MKFRNVMILAALGGAAYYYRDTLMEQWEKLAHGSQGSEGSMTITTPDTGSTGTTGTTGGSSF